MSSFGEAFDPSLEMPISLDEAANFADTVVWGGVNKLWGGDFRATAPPGEEMSLTRKIMVPEGLIRRLIQPQGPIRINLSASCYLDYDHDEEEPLRVCWLSIAIEDMRPELTDSMLLAAQAHIHEDPDDQYREQAWHYESFSFSTDPDEPLEKLEGFELQDEEGESIWDDSELVQPESEEVPISPGQEMVLEELAKGYRTQISGLDRLKVQAALAALGLVEQPVADDQPVDLS